jgi:hypothetical protein
MKPITLTTGFSIFGALCLQQPDLAVVMVRVLLSGEVCAEIAN